MSRLTHLDHAGMRFDVHDAGPLEGEPVVLLHGFPQTSSSWEAVAPVLHAAGMRTYALDQRGYSPGARPRRRRDYRLDLLVGDVVALLERTGPAHVVGHDWGAAVAWYVAARHPELTRTLTALSVPHPGAMVRGGPQQWRMSWYIAAFQLPLVPEYVLTRDRDRTLALLREGGMGERALARFGPEMVLGGALPFALKWYRAVPLSRPSILRERVPVPTAYVWSDGDIALGRQGAELCGEMVHGDYRMVTVPGASHWLPEEVPDVVARVVLDRVRDA